MEVVMLAEEASAIRAILAGFRDDELSPMLDVGASTREFRETSQPYIFKEIAEPLRARGIRCVNLDLKTMEGIDLAGDLLEPAIQARAQELSARCVLCANVLEHVEDVDKFAEALEEIVPVGGLLVVSVPQSYPYHLDPIDNEFRPTPEQLAAKFRRSTLLSGQTVVGESYSAELRRKPVRERVLVVLKAGVHLLLPFYKPEMRKTHLQRLWWLWRPYRVSLIVMRRAAGAGSVTSA